MKTFFVMIREKQRKKKKQDNNVLHSLELFPLQKYVRCLAAVKTSNTRLKQKRDKGESSGRNRNPLIKLFSVFLEKTAKNNHNLKVFSQNPEWLRVRKPTQST